MGSPFIMRSDAAVETKGPRGPPPGRPCLPRPASLGKFAMSAWSMTARYVFPVDGPPLPGGVVVVDGGRLVAVEPCGMRKSDVDLGNVAILPGLANAHTHLDLTGMRGKCPPTPDFAQWLRGVIAYRRGQ